MSKVVVVVIILGLLGAVVFTMRPDTIAEAVELEKTHASMEAGVEDAVFELYIADTDAKRVQGLSGVKALSENEGMLFMFPQRAKHGIWMKDMHFAIDIVWLDTTKNIISIKDSVSPDTFPRIFYPGSDAQYVIELPAGTTMKHKIEVGNTFKF